MAKPKQIQGSMLPQLRNASARKSKTAFKRRLARSSRWAVSHAGFTLSGAGLQAAFEAALGRLLRRARFPWPLLRLATLLSPMLRALFEMRYLWQRPHRLADSRLRAQLGELPQTALAEVVRQCLAGLSGPAPAVAATGLPALKT